MGVNVNFLAIYGHKITNLDEIDAIESDENLQDLIYPDYYSGKFVYIGITLAYIREYDEYEFQELDVSKLKNLEFDLKSKLKEAYDKYPFLLNSPAKFYMTIYYT